MGDDLGTQAAPQLRPDVYHETIHPRHKAVYSWVHEHYPTVKVFLHCCGSVYDLMPDLIDEGVDVLNPVQTSAAKMDPRRLKAEFGDRIAFWGGGCDTQIVLPNATPDEIRAHVRERVEIFKPGGGYVFNMVHNVQANVPAGERRRDVRRGALERGILRSEPQMNTDERRRPRTLRGRLPVFTHPCASVVRFFVLYNADTKASRPGNEACLSGSDSTV